MSRYAQSHHPAVSSDCFSPSDQPPASPLANHCTTVILPGKPSHHWIHSDIHQDSSTSGYCTATGLGHCQQRSGWQLQTSAQVWLYAQAAPTPNPRVYWRKPLEREDPARQSRWSLPILWARHTTTVLSALLKVHGSLPIPPTCIPMLLARLNLNKLDAGTSWCSVLLFASTLNLLLNLVPQSSCTPVIINCHPNLHLLLLHSQPCHYHCWPHWRPPSPPQNCSCSPEWSMHPLQWSTSML